MFARLFATNDKPYVPGWDNKREVRFNLSGVKFSMLVPYSNAPDGANMREGEFVNIYDPEAYPEPREDTPEYKRSPFRGLNLFSELWESVGALVGGRSAGMYFDATVLKDTEQPKSKSCFRAIDFQQVIDRQIYYRFGPPRTGDFLPIAPVDWKICKIGGVDWVRYSVFPDISRWQDQLPKEVLLERTWRYLTPVSDGHFICLSITVDNYSPREAGGDYCARLIDEMVSSTSISGLPVVADFGGLDNPRSGFIWQPHKLKKVEDKRYGFITVLDELGTPPPTYEVTTK